MAENVNHGISLSSAGGVRDKQRSLLWMGLTLTPIKTSLIPHFSGLKEVGEEEKCEFMYDTVVFLVTQPKQQRVSWDILPQRVCPFMFKCKVDR